MIMLQRKEVVAFDGSELQDQWEGSVRAIKGHVTKKIRQLTGAFHAEASANQIRFDTVNKKIEDVKTELNTKIDHATDKIEKILTLLQDAKE